VRQASKPLVSSRRRILGLNAARLYKLPTGQGDEDDEQRGGFGGREEDDLGQIYKPVPANYQDLFDPETKRIMEFSPSWVPCGDSCSTNPFSQDNMSRMKAMYAEAGGRPDHLRMGWIRIRR
jgi:hypothetical protein